MPVFFDKGVVLRVEPLAQVRHTTFTSFAFFLIEQLTQGIPELNHGSQAQSGGFIFYGDGFITSVAELPGSLEDDFSALRFNAECAHFQGLEVVGSQEVMIETGFGFTDFGRG